MTEIKTDDDDDQVVKDGHVVRVPFMLMDEQQRGVAAGTIIKDALAPAMHRPGFATLTDAMMKDRIKAYDAYTVALTERWKAPPPVATPLNHKEPVNQMHAALNAAPTEIDKANAAREQTYAGYDKKLSERWRGTAAA